jgi:hypothetical protein
MNSTLDLNLLLLARHDDVDSGALPDAYVANPPHRAARGRESDSLIIYLSLVGNSPLSPQAHAQLLEQQAQKFYKTTGSLTAALRTIAEALNLYLLDRNLRSTSAGRQGIGQLLLVALRADNLYIAQSGAVQAFLVTPDETQPLYDLQTSGHGLGLSRSTPVRYLQIKMAAEDYLVLSTVPGTGWSHATIRHPSGQGLEALRHQLEVTAGPEFNVVIVLAQAGTGKIKLIKHKAEAGVEAALQSVVVPPAAAPSTPVAAEEKLLETTPAVIPAYVPTKQPDQDYGLGVVTTAIVTSPPASGEASGPRKEPTLPVAPVVAVASQQAGSTERSSPQAATPAISTSQPGGLPVEPSKLPKSPPPPRPWGKHLTAFRVALASILAALWRALRSALSTIGGALLRLLKNLLPDADVLRLPPSTMVFIAIAIPLILAVVGGMVFLQRGQAQQHQIFYEQAVKKADYASTLTNPLEQRLALQTALGALNKAEEYAVTSQSQALRVKLTTNLDALDTVKRLDYQPAIVNGLESGINVTRIVASAADLYLLDGNQGSVLHAIMTARGYEIDPTFNCGPINGPINVGPLVDIAELPPGGYENASLLGIDSNGNLLYCIIGSQPLSATLAPPNTGLGKPIGISIDRGDLYVLDPTVNAVWIYPNMEVSQQPRLFFGDTVPPMQDVIDLEVYNDDLYMLHADGHTTKCTYSSMAQSPTRCEDPYPYSDNRPGRTHTPVIEDAVFSQIDYITFPERAIFYLDPKNQAIYYFSVLLTLQYQYQPKTPLAEGDATAFAISPNRIAFLAVGNNVYYAAMP